MTGKARGKEEIKFYLQNKMKINFQNKITVYFQNIVLYNTKQFHTIRYFAPIRGAARTDCCSWAFFLIHLPLKQTRYSWPKLEYWLPLDERCCSWLKPGFRPGYRPQYRSEYRPGYRLLSMESQDQETADPPQTAPALRPATEAIPSAREDGRSKKCRTWRGNEVSLSGLYQSTVGRRGSARRTLGCTLHGRMCPRAGL